MGQRLKREGVYVYLYLIHFVVGFPGGSVIKNPSALWELQEMRIRSLGREDPLEEGMATHCSIVARRIPWTDKLGRSDHRIAKSDTTEAT